MSKVFTFSDFITDKINAAIQFEDYCGDIILLTEKVEIVHLDRDEFNQLPLELEGTYSILAGDFDKDECYVSDTIEWKAELDCEELQHPNDDIDEMVYNPTVHYFVEQK